MSDFKNPPCELDEEFVALGLGHQPQHEVTYLRLYGQDAKTVRESVGGIWVVNTDFLVFFGAEGATPLVKPVK